MKGKTIKLVKHEKGINNCIFSDKLQEDDKDISTGEGILMTALWSLFVGYIGYSVYLDSHKIFTATSGQYFLYGWKITNRLKDFSNLEWEFWRDFWAERAWPVMLGHILVNLLIPKKSQKAKLQVNLAYSVFALWWLTNWKILIFMLTYITVGYLVTLTGNALLIWGAALITLFAIAADVITAWASKISGDGLYQRKQALTVFSVTMITLRFVSFGLDWSEHKKSASSNQSTTEMKDMKRGNKDLKGQEVSIIYNYIYYLHYSLYIPLFFAGPMFNYDQFQKEYWKLTAIWDGKSIKAIITYGLRVAFAFIICELMLHYMYFNAVYQSIETMESMSLWTVAGIHYYHGQFFMVKYVVLYGLPRLMAMTDHLDAPMTPNCIGRISTSLPMWRSFDRGLHMFMKSYIYIPIGGGHQGVFRKILASGLCFTFIFVWHGLTMAIFLCVLVNFIDLALETLADSISIMPAVQKFKEKHLSKSSVIRINCLLRAPLKLFTTIAANLYFALDVKVGVIYVNRLVFEGFFLFVLVFYCLGITDHFISSKEKRHRSGKKEDPYKTLKVTKSD